MVETAKLLGHEDDEGFYAKTLKNGTEAYNKHLWNGLFKKKILYLFFLGQCKNECVDSEFFEANVL